MKESSIERRLVIEVKKRGGLAAKFVSPGLDGVPDRIALLPGGRMAFVELKTPGNTLRPLQELRKEQLESLGFRVFVVDGLDQIGVVLDAIQSA
ncbi:MAG: VRR-NUC domain-containing protein [Candidatus Limiplasma sp.]|nr:VRR-NUC domain-containing protein [Candidatus Limiplasma sp.]